MNLGIRGSCYASSVTMFINLTFITIISCYIEEIKDAWFMPNRESLLGIVEYMKIGVPMMLVNCLEFWAFHIQSFILIFLSVEAMAA